MHPELGSGDLRALRDKYERILALRVVHAKAKKDPDFAEPDPRREMTRIAARYPGALREIDTLTIQMIRARIRALARAERDAGRVATWMIAQARFHDLARAILAAKRWLAARDGGLPRAAAAWKDDLERVAKPPRGRLMDLVHARVAEELGVTVDQSRALVFGP